MEADRRTVQRLALSEWSPQAAARVVSVGVVGRRAEVALVVNDGYEYWAYFRRDDAGWHQTIEGNGPVVGWKNPDDVEWG